MIWKLTDEIWWGDRACPTDDEAQEVGAVLNVATNLSLDFPEDPDHPPSYDFFGFPEATPYFRLPVDDDAHVTREYLWDVVAIIEMVERNNWFPLLIHCWKGLHRSPALAVYAAFHLATQDQLGLPWPRSKWDQLMERMASLRPEYVFLNFGKTLQKYILTLSK